MVSRERRRRDAVILNDVVLAAPSMPGSGPGKTASSWRVARYERQRQRQRRSDPDHPRRCSPYSSSLTRPGKPAVALTEGDPDYANSLSYLPGQRLSQCTCTSDTSHPGPVYSNGTFKGRAAPEIDMFEALVTTDTLEAPFNPNYEVSAVLQWEQTEGTGPEKERGGKEAQSARWGRRRGAPKWEGSRGNERGRETPGCRRPGYRRIGGSRRPGCRRIGCRRNGFRGPGCLQEARD
jgi:hypothetical protein